MLTIFLTADDVANLVCTAYPDTFVADWGVLAGGVARPGTGFADGTEAYPTLHAKAAALLHSLATTQPFNDGNKRAAAMACKAMLDINGWSVVCSDTDFYNLIMDVAEGQLHEVEKIAEALYGISEASPLPPLT